MGELLRSLWRHLSARRRRQFGLLMLLMLFSVLAEVVSIGAVVPFIGILAAPEQAMRHSVVASLARLFNVAQASQLVLPLTLLFGAAALISGAVRLVFTWASTRFTFAAGADLSFEVYRRTLAQPYEVHIRRSSSEIISGISTKVGSTILGVILPFTVLVSSTLLLLAVIAALLIIDPKVAVLSAGGFGLAYGVVSWVTNDRLRRNSEFVSREQTEVVKALQEGLGGIRDVLLDGTQGFYLAVYQRADRVLRRALGTNIFIVQSPKPLIEAFGTVLIAALALGLSLQPGGIAAGIPALAALALGAQRLLPALQSAFASWGSIVGSQGTVGDVITLLEQPYDESLSGPQPAPLAVERAITFQKVRFRYAADAPWVLDGLDLKLSRGARIGFVGGTGSGKSTTMDLLMGLLRPEEGVIAVDDVPLGKANIRAWQRNIAHVPQAIYLADASLAENIAFGVPRSEIDMDRVRDSARRARIAEHIEGRPGGYDAHVGERGVRLSGGQRQRIGIARALYKRAGVLVLDEATSALDNVTERSVMEAIEGLDRDLTILIIAHRLTTVARCDTIVQVEAGRVIAQGSYEQLLESSQSFRQMARAATF
jgi:ABC-type multidrug transport system fused ATPase/permease subunit